MAEIETVQQRPRMPTTLLQALIEGDDQVLTEMLGLGQEDGGHITIPIELPADVTIQSPAENEHYNNLQSATFMGNTVLHVLCAFNHDVLASKVCKKDGSLLRARNKLLETPLHYAAKGIVNEKAIKALLDFARSEGELILKGVLRDRNCHGETALHVVATYYKKTFSWEDNITIVKTMIEGDLEWADQVDNNGVSSFDLGITRNDSIGEYMILQLPSQRILSRKTRPRANQPTTLHSNLSSAEIAQELTEISTSADTTYPIHIAISAGTTSYINSPSGTVTTMLERDPSLAYLQDSDGLFPVHVAARKGEVSLLIYLMRRYPDCGELVDHHERNFLHIAAEENMWGIFSKLLKNSISPFWDNIIERMMFTTDKKGNTPMHIASEKGSKSLMKIIYTWEFGKSWRCKGYDNIRNRKGQSAFDISVIEVKARMKNSMEIDDIIEKYIQDHPKGLTSAWCDMVMPVADEKESNMMDQLQIIGLGAVLITTVAFAAAFTLPGGYNSNGSPLLAGEYLFKAFILAITSAFLQSFFCVLMLMIGGLSSIDRSGKAVFLSIAMYLFSGGARSMVLSFGLGLYLVLAPVHKGVSKLILLLAFGSVMLDITPSVLRFIIKSINWMGSGVRWDVVARQFSRIVIFLGVLRFIIPFVFIFILALLP